MANQLENARYNIDRINKEIVEKIDERMDEVIEILEYKEKNNIGVKDEGREDEVKKQFSQLFQEKNLPGNKGEELAELLIDIAVDYQTTKVKKEK